MKYIQRWVYSFAITCLILILFNIGVFVRLGLNPGYIRVTLGAVVISALIAASITIFKMKKGNDILKAFLGLLPLLPINLIMRNIYGPIVFRAAIFFWTLAFIFAMIYSLVVVVVSHKAKKEEKELNVLLKDKEKENQK